MRLCIFIGEERTPPGVRAPARRTQRAIDRSHAVEDALLAFGRESGAAGAPGWEVVAITLGGRELRGAARHALTAGAREVVQVEVDDLHRLSDAEASRLAAGALRSVGCDVAVAGVEGAGGWSRLAGQIAERLGVTLCTSMRRIVHHAGGETLAEHDLEDEHVVLAHHCPIVTTAASRALWSPPTFSFQDVIDSRDGAVRNLKACELDLDPPVIGAQLRPRPARPLALRREVVCGEDAAAAAAQFLRVIGAIR